MKKKLAIALLAALLLAGTFTSCCVSPSGTQEELFNSGVNVTTDGIDYNEYIASKGYFIYTDSAYLFFNDNKLTFLEPTLSTPISVMCSKPNCPHNTEDCTAYIETIGIGIWNNKLYYVQEDKDTFAVGIYRMDINGKNRILVRTLDVDQSKGYFYMYNISGGYLILNFSEFSPFGNINTLYLYSLEDPTAESIVIFSNREEMEKIITEDNDNSDSYTFDLGAIAPGVPKNFFTCQREGWIFYDISLDGDTSLYGYEIATDESTLITEDWNGGALSVVDDTLYWYNPGAPLRTTQLSTGETTEYMSDMPNNESWWASCDNLYFYVTPDVDTFVKGETALKIYDYEGKELISLEAEKQLSYAFSTPDRVFFFDMSAANFLPVCYLEKSAIDDGTAKFIYLE